MELRVFTDGGSLNNPGMAAYAYVFFKGDRVIYKQAEKIGVASNNFAEYTALIKALEKIRELVLDSLKNCSRIVFFSDSLLMVNQLNGLFKIKDGNIKDFVFRARCLEQEIKTPIVYQHIPREKNTLADSLVKSVLKKTTP